MDHTVTYHFGRRDYIALLQGNRALGLLGRFGRWGRYASFALFVVVLLNLLNIFSWSFDMVTFLIVSAVMFVIVLVAAPIGEFIADRLLSLWVFPRLSVAEKDCTLVFGEDGIRSKYGDIEGRVPWRSIVRIMDAKEYIYLTISRAEMILVPKRALPSPDAAEALVHYIKSMVDFAASGSPEGPRTTRGEAQ
jgi:hypothetical protein